MAKHKHSHHSDPTTAPPESSSDLPPDELSGEPPSDPSNTPAKTSWKVTGWDLKKGQDPKAPKKVNLPGGQSTQVRKGKVVYDPALADSLRTQGVHLEAC